MDDNLKQNYVRKMITKMRKFEDELEFWSFDWLVGYVKVLKNVFF